MACHVGSADIRDGLEVVQPLVLFKTSEGAVSFVELLEGMPPAELRCFVHSVLCRSIRAEIVNEMIDISIDVVVKGGVGSATRQ